MWIKCLIAFVIALGFVQASYDVNARCTRRLHEHELCTQHEVAGTTLHAQCRYTPALGIGAVGVAFTYTVADEHHSAVEHYITKSCNFVTNSTGDKNSYLCQIQIESFNTTAIATLKCVIWNGAVEMATQEMIIQSNGKIINRDKVDENDVTVWSPRYPSLRWNIPITETSEVIMYTPDKPLKAVCTLKDAFRGFSYELVWILQGVDNASHVVTRMPAKYNDSINLGLNLMFKEEHNGSLLKCSYYGNGPITLEKFAKLQMDASPVVVPEPEKDGAKTDVNARCTRRLHEHELCTQHEVAGTTLHAQCRYTPALGIGAVGVAFTYTVADEHHSAVEHYITKSCNFVTNSTGDKNSYLCQIQIESFNTAAIATLKCVIRNGTVEMASQEMIIQSNGKIINRDKVDENDVTVWSPRYPSLRWNIPITETSEVIMYTPDKPLKAVCTLKDAYRGFSYELAWILQGVDNASHVVTRMPAKYSNDSMHLGLNLMFKEEHNGSLLKCAYYREGSIPLEKLAKLQMDASKTSPVVVPELEKDGEKTDSAVTWVVSVLVVLLLIALIFVIYLYYRRRRKDMSEGPEQSNKTEGGSQAIAESSIKGHIKQQGHIESPTTESEAKKAAYNLSSRYLRWTRQETTKSKVICPVQPPDVPTCSIEQEKPQQKVPEVIFEIPQEKPETKRVYQVTQLG